MKNNLSIDISNLSKVLEILFEHLKKKGVQEVVLDKDYYWEIDSKELYNVTANPIDLTVGSLFTDLEFVDKLAKREHMPVAPHFIKVAALLRYLGEAVEEKK